MFSHSSIFGSSIKAKSVAGGLGDASGHRILYAGKSLNSNLGRSWSIRPIKNSNQESIPIQWLYMVLRTDNSWRQRRLCQTRSCVTSNKDQWCQRIIRLERDLVEIEMESCSHYALLYDVLQTSGQWRQVDFGWWLHSLWRWTFPLLEKVVRLERQEGHYDPLEMEVRCSLLIDEPYLNY